MIDNQDNSELFSTRNVEITEIINNFPFQIQFGSNMNLGIEELSFSLWLKEKKEDIDDLDIGKIDFVLDAKQKYLELSDKFNLNLIIKNYFGRGINNLTFFIKMVIQEQETNDEYNNDNNNLNEENEEENIDNI
jgi:hypothetical protein